MIDRIRKYSLALRGAGHCQVRRWPTPIQHNEDSIEERAAKLRRFLEDSGPVYSSFALYLSSRIDLLPAEYCRELQSIPDCAPELTSATVEQVMIEELGASFPTLFNAFALIPIRSGLIGQTHKAELVNGEAVTVFVIRPEYISLPKANELKEWFRGVPLPDICSDCSRQEIFVDFLAALQRATDLRIRSQAAAPMVARQDLQGKSMGRRFYRELSGRNILTLSFADETNLDQSLHAGGYDLQTLAREVCKRWLSQSLDDRFCPVDPTPFNIMTTGPLDIHFGGNEFIELPRHTKDNLRRYLLATSDDDPDRAAHYLLQEMTPPRDGMNKAAEFHSTFRQAASFGALEPVLGTNTNALAQFIFQHWKTALDHGYKPTPPLLCFYRGLFAIARMAWKIAPAADPLRDGMEELQATMAAEEFNEITAASYWIQSSDKFANAMFRLPHSADEALNQAARPGRNHWSESPPQRSSRAPHASVAKWALVVAAIVFLLRGDGTAWTQNGMVLILMMAGLIVLGVWED